MARDFAKILTRIWSDQDWRALTRDEQWLYMHLVTRSDLSYAGVADWRPKRLTPLATDISVHDVELAAAALQARGYIVIDEDTEEVLVRSYHRNDEALKQTNMGAAVKKAYFDVASSKLMGVIVWELQRLHHDRPGWKGWAGIAEILEHPAHDPAVYRQEPLPGADAPPVADTQEPPF